MKKTLGGLFFLLSSLGFTLLVLFFTPLILAGGGGVDTRVTNTEDSHWNIVRVYFDPKLFTCKGMNVSFNFESPENGDVISGTNGSNFSTITDDANLETVNGKQYLRCSTYAKVYSAELKWNRILNISFNGAGLAGERKIAVSFGVKYNPDDLPLFGWESLSDPVTVSTPPVQPRTDLDSRPTTTPYPEVTPEPKAAEQPLITDNENNNKALNQKIADLEAQLVESKQKQNALESRLNQLIAWIKSIFPFFK